MLLLSLLSLALTASEVAPVSVQETVTRRLVSPETVQYSDNMVGGWINGYIIRCLVDIISFFSGSISALSWLTWDQRRRRAGITWQGDCIYHYNKTFSVHCLCLQGRSSDCECPLLRRWHSPSPRIHQVTTFAKTEHPSSIALCCMCCSVMRRVLESWLT